MTKLQLSSIISQAMFVGETFNGKEEDLLKFKKYARGMMEILLRDINLYDESVIEKALEDFLSTKEWGI